MEGIDTQELPREPNQTIYLNNLNEKVRKDELRHCLYALCSQFGPILDVVATRTLRMRGQAFVVFKDVAAASAAIHKLSGFPFFDKPMRAQYAESKSDIVARLDGTYSEQEKQRQKEAKAARKAAKASAPNLKKRPAPGDLDGEPEAKRPAFEPPVDINPPNKILFIQHVPEGVTSATLSGIFGKFTGFKEVKVPKAGLAFAFYETEHQASQAMAEYQGWKFAPEDHGLLVTYAKH